MHALKLFVPLFALFAACGDTVDPVGPPETETVDLTDAPADGIAQLRVRADGMTVWAETRVLSENDWLVQLRTSHSIASASASVEGEAARTKIVSARKLEVRLTSTQMADNLAESPLFVTVQTTSAKTYNVMVVARARFVETTGSSKLYPWRNIEPIMVGRDRVFRARITTPDDLVFVAGHNDDDSEPLVSQEDPTHWRLDWYHGSLVWAAHPTEDALFLVGEDARGTRYRRTAPIHMEIVKLGVSNEPTDIAWPAPVCTESTRTCVAGFHAETGDMEACGTIAEVEPCLAEIPEDNTADWIEQFTDDFRRHLIRYYGQHEADIVGSGGNTRPQALVSVDNALVSEVSDPDEIPSGHDLDTHRVFTHPDVTFPGSDIVWFGVYNRATGALVEIYDFN